MTKRYRWRKEMMCPEGRGSSALFVEWRGEEGHERLNGISCDNLQLKDLSGREVGKKRGIPCAGIDIAPVFQTLSKRRGHDGTIPPRL